MWSPDCGRWGLTLAEISDLTADYLGRPEEPVGPRLAAVLAEVRARTRQQIAVLQTRLDQIDGFEAQYKAELAGWLDFREHDPRLGATRT